MLATKVRKPPSKECIPTKFSPALKLLDEAYQYAVTAGCDLWKFAVPALELMELGLSGRDLQWLVIMGYCEVGIASTNLDGKRRFEQFDDAIPIQEDMYLILTDDGLRAVDRFFARRTVTPEWDARRRELRVHECVVKQFRVPSRNQELILRAFQEEGWPTRIDDPLPPADEINAKQRLSETVKSLNRHHKMSLVRFCGDGTGQGICWRIIPTIGQ